MKLKYLKIYLISLSLQLAFFSCSDNEIEIPQNKLGEKQLVLNYTIDNATPVSYAVAEESHECEVQDIYTLFFNPGDKKYAGHTRSGVNSTTATGSTNVTLPVSVNVEDAWHLLFFANLDVYANRGSHADTDSWLKSVLNGKTIDQAKTILSALAADVSGIEAPLPMSAEEEKQSGTDNISVTLKRRVARMDVKVNPTLTAGAFELVSAQVWNARTRTDFFSAAPVVASTATDEYVHYKSRYAQAIDNAITAQLYAFPNKVDVPVKNDEKTTCLIIGGKYNGSPVTSYYRVNLKKASSTAHELKANTAYTINVTGVLGEGLETPEAAMKSTVFLVDYNIIEWNQFSPNDYYIDQYGNKLAVSKRRVSLSSMRDVEFILDVYTTQAAVSPILVNWTYSLSGGADDTKFSIEEITGSPRRLKIKTTSLNEEKDYKALLTIRWGGLQIPVSLHQATALQSDAGIQASPAVLFFRQSVAVATTPETAKVVVDLKDNNFAGFNPTNLIVEKNDPANAGWLSVDNGVYNSANGTVTYTFSAEALPSDLDARRAEVKFLLNTANGNASTTVSVLQLKDNDDVAGFEQRVKIHLFEKPSTGAYIDKSSIPDCYERYFGFDPAKIKHNALQFALNDKNHNYFKLSFRSALTWEIIPDDNVKKFVSFHVAPPVNGPGPEKLQGGGLPLQEEEIFVTAKQDILDPAGLVPWSGSFKIRFADGMQHEYLIFQQGIFQELKKSADSNKNGTYYYGTSFMLGKQVLDRYLGATSNKWFDKSTSKGDLAAYSGTTGAWVSSDCPKGFRLLNEAEAERYQKDLSLYSGGDYNQALYFPAGLLGDPTYISLIASLPNYMALDGGAKQLRLKRSAPYAILETATVPPRSTNSIALCVRR